MATIPDIYQLYNGFYICNDNGNNEFSLEKRTIKKIWVAPLVEGDLKDLRVGNQTAFNEIEDGIEKRCIGLKHFIHWKRDYQQVFIFDNHNHAFFFWLWGYQQGLIPQGPKLVHIDQHSDMREPPQRPAFSLGSFDLQEAFQYTNFQLNVGNFIRPALHLKLFSEVIQIDGNYSLSKDVPDEPFVLDLDLDFFAREMDFIDDNFSIPIVKSYIKKASLVTCATSPYFIDQTRALSFFEILFG